MDFAFMCACGDLAVSRITAQKCMVMPVPMNQLESVRLQGAYHPLRLCPGNLREEIVELDTKLLDLNMFSKAAFQHLILETLNINFQQVDEIVAIRLHLTRKAGAGKGLVPAGL